MEQTLGVARTVPNSHVIVFFPTPLVFSTVNGAAPGADLGFFIRRSNAEGVRPSRGVRGHAPPENFEI